MYENNNLYQLAYVQMALVEITTAPEERRSHDR